mmetsp:Transcript_30721/g.91052  ORF Transcript_30721/g.91052 Transcript_30721/m.91052 type:complete len:721 (-) Transcript_30721:2123-4285(-)
MLRTPFKFYAPSGVGAPRPPGTSAWTGPAGARCHGGVAGLFEREAVQNAPAKFKREARSRLKGVKQLPWEVAMTAEDAAKGLGSFLGASDIQPAAVLDLTKEQIHAILDETTNKGNTALEKALYSHADAVTTRFFGDEIYYRGIVEFSNVCKNDCNYCGIRKHMNGVMRYTMPVEEVVEVARWAFENHLGNIMLQSGELPGEARLRYLTRLVREIREATVAMDRSARGDAGKGIADSELGMAVSLSVGELPRSDYEALFAAGARRYLLRIETSNPDLYKALHPHEMSWEQRVRCLQDLKDVGYMIGTGVMVGLPGQTLQDLSGDIRFFKDIGANMIGMGPYITEEGTPTAEAWGMQYGSVDKKAHMKAMFDLTTRMNALARTVVGNANISATTALQAIDPMGREIALRRGSNVLMPILTPTKYREHYQLYEGKPCITDTAEECRRCLNARITMIGKRVTDSVWGDPPNFLKPIVGVPVAGGGAAAVAAAPADVAPRSLHTLACPVALTSRNKPATGARPLQGSAGLPLLHTTSRVHTRRCGGLLGGSKAMRAFWSSAPPSAPASAPAAVQPLQPSTDRGSDVQRINIGVFGVMNAGKSTAINAITRQDTSIVDATPGTTADVKVALMELHDFGPAKLFDTAGIDEEGALGNKKRAKTLSTLKECDVALIVLDGLRLLPLAAPGAAKAALRDALKWELQLMQVLTGRGSVGEQRAVARIVR